MSPSVPQRNSRIGLLRVYVVGDFEMLGVVWFWERRVAGAGD